MANKAQDLESAGQLGLGFTQGEMTHVPDTDWSPPEELPDKLYGLVGFDLETNDVGIRSGQGAGWAWRGGGHVVGYAVAADNFTGYLPVGHQGGGNMDPDLVRRWLNHVLGDESQPKVGASTMYDVGWARRDGVNVKGKIYDVQWAEALLDEHRFSYSLNACATNHLNESKDESLLREAAQAYGVDAKSGLWKLPAPFVGPYAEKDADLARRIWLAQEPKLRAEDLWDLSELEHALLPLYVDMRWRGVPVDLDHAEKLRVRWAARSKEITEELTRRAGFRVDIWSADSIARALDAEGLSYGTTAKTGKPSITKLIFQRHKGHWLADLIQEAREVHKLSSTFLDSQIFNQVHDGRIHGEIHPLRSDEGGTVTGRLSMSNPNLQFIPSRKPEGKEIRRCFLPEKGQRWYSADLSQQEPRLLVHFAALTRYHGEPLPGVEDILKRYQEDPDLSYHTWAEEITGLEYKAAKVLNLAIIYGRGVRTTAEELERSVEDTQAMFDRHEAGMPFAKKMAKICHDRAEERGFVRSLLGRKTRFSMYEPRDWDKRDNRREPLWKARKTWPGEPLVRARLHKALNSLIQPSAADQVKKAMLDAYQAGLGEYLTIQVHDELNFTSDDDKVGREMIQIMENAVKLKVPVKAKLAVGPNWADAKEIG